VEKEAELDAVLFESIVRALSKKRMIICKVPDHPFAYGYLTKQPTEDFIRSTSLTFNLTLIVFVTRPPISTRATLAPVYLFAYSAILLSSHPS
jgi:L-aminoadipate-semialdehyde dehydrogenase